MGTPTDSKSLAERVRTQILEAILAGRFEHRLPAEGDLARMLDVSRTTLRTALSGLERDGVVTRRRAVGTTINSHVSSAALALQRHVGFDWALRERGHDVRVDVEVTPGPPPRDAVAEFGIDKAARTLLIAKTYLADGRSALWVRDIVPIESLRPDAPLDDIPTQLPELSRQIGRWSVDHVVAQIAAAAKDGANTALELREGTPFTRLLETYYGSDAEAFGYSIVDVDESVLRLELFRRELG
jgi:GntR family transcriptional regulator